VRAIDRAGNIIEDPHLWWWQLPDNAPPAEVRMICASNALTEVASRSRAPTVRVAIVDVLIAYALAVDEHEHAPRHQDEIRLPMLLDRALVHPDRDVQKVAAGLWREVLGHHRAEWQAEAQRLMAKWNDTASLLHDLRKRPEGKRGTGA
jgi:hypothetical protein